MLTPESAALNPEIVTSRILNASPDEVFAAFRDPARLARWWGPAGFTNEFHQFDFRPGGRWHFVMIGPDQSRYALEKEFLEVIVPERIVYRNLQAGHQFRMTMTFEELAGRTELTWRMLFESNDEFLRVRDFVSQANEQNFDRLEAHLAESHR